MTDASASPQWIDVSQADDVRDVIHRAVACLAQGGVVGLATETVYGVAACALNAESVSASAMSARRITASVMVSYRIPLYAETMSVALYTHPDMLDHRPRGQPGCAQTSRGHLGVGVNEPDALRG